MNRQTTSTVIGIGLIALALVLAGRGAPPVVAAPPPSIAMPAQDDTGATDTLIDLVPRGESGIAAAR